MRAFSQEGRRAAASSSSCRRVESASERRPARILVVEDEEAIAEGLLLNLERKGYAVELARDGTEALARVARGALRPDRARRAAAGGRRLRGLPAAARRGQPHAHPHAHRARPARRHDLRPQDRRRRLRGEALRPRRAAGAGREPAAPAGLVAAGGRGRPPGAAGREPPRRLEFGDYWVDFDTYEAKTRAGRRPAVAEGDRRAARLPRAGRSQVVTRRELLAEVWQLPHHPNTGWSTTSSSRCAKPSRTTPGGRATSSACAASATASCPESRSLWPAR